MLVIALYLAVASFFIPKRYKNICCYISMGVFGVSLLWSILYNLFGIGVHFISSFLSFGWQINPVNWTFYWISRWIYGIWYSRILWIIVKLVEYGIYFGIAFAAMNISVIQYSSDNEEDNYEYKENARSMNTEGTTIQTFGTKQHAVIEVNAGLCTGTIRGIALENRINQMARQGWKFEQFETIIGRCCLIFQRYKAIVCFSRELWQIQNQK